MVEGHFLRRQDVELWDAGVEIEGGISNTSRALIRADAQRTAVLARLLC